MPYFHKGQVSLLLSQSSAINHPNMAINHNASHKISQSLFMPRSHFVLQELKLQVTMQLPQIALTLIGLLVKSVVGIIIRHSTASTVWIFHSKENALQVS
jgi:hypothetical protein